MNTTNNYPYHHDRAQGMPFFTLLMRCAVFLIIFIFVAIVSSLVCSIIFFNTTNPTSKIDVASLCALYSSVALCSILLTRINGEKWLLGGLILGIMIYLCTLILAFFVNGESNSNNIIMRALILPISVLFAFLTRKKNKSRHKSKFKKHKVHS